MALIIKDRIKESSTFTGTGDIALGGSTATFSTFASVMTTNDTTYYAIVHTSSGVDEWEVGLGTFNASGDLERTTVLSGSSGTSAVNFSSGIKAVFMTYPADKAVFSGSDASFANITVTGTVDGRDVATDGTKLDGVEAGADVTDATNVAAAGALMTSGGTMTGALVLNSDPTAALGAATKQYVDTIAAAGIHYHTPVRVESPTALTVTYDNGTAGVGATLTNAGTQEAITIDGVALSLNDRVLVYTQTDATQNGVYTVTTVGDGSTNWVLTRATDADSYSPSDKDALGEGDAYFVKEGNTGAGELYVMNTSGTITFGTTNITFEQIAETAVYSAGDSLTLTGTVFDTVQDIRTTASPTFASVTADLTGNVTGNVTGSSGSTTGNAATATALATARTIQLSGDVTGSVSFDGTGDVNITAAVVDDSHAHVISNVDGLQAALDAKTDQTRILTAGNGFAAGSGGDLTANRTFTIGGGTGVTINANDVAIGQDVATTATPTFAGMTTTGDISFGDNDKAIFGAGSDLQIFHDGTHTYIDETNPTGYLFIRGANTQLLSPSNDIYLECNNDGAVDLYHDNSKKLATTATGVNVVGTLTSDDIAISDSSPTFTMTDTDTNALFRISASSAVGSVTFEVDENGVGSNPQFLIQGQNVNRFNIDTDNGDISFYDAAGVSQSLFWDASAESLGIGTSSPATALDVVGTITSDGLTVNGITYPSSDGSNGQVLTTDGSGTLSFQDGGGGAGADAATLDGLDSSQFLRSDVDGTLAGVLTIDGGLEGVSISSPIVLNNPNLNSTSSGDYFGENVSIDGNYAIVGVRGEDEPSNSGSGKAYIYNVTTGALVHTLHNPNAYNTSAGDAFGYSVGISGNYAIVGAASEDDASGSGVGIAYIFDVTTGLLVHTLYNPNAYGTPVYDSFGDMVAIDGNYAIVAVAYEDDAGGSASGIAYIFDVTTGALVYTLNNPNAYDTSANDRFGSSVAISGNYTIVAARGEDDAGGTNSGKAYIFDLTTGLLVHTLDNPNPFDISKSDGFGNAVAIDGNYAIISADGEDETGFTNSGKAYIYNVTTGALLHTLDNPNAYGTPQSDYFGDSVAIYGNYALVGCTGEDDAGGNSSGKTYVFDVTTGALLLTLDNPNAVGVSGSDYFGQSVAISGTKIIVGAYWEYDDAGIKSGKAYIYDLASKTLSVDGDVTISNSLTVNGITYPLSDGTNSQVITTDGHGALSFEYKNVENIDPKTFSTGTVTHDLNTAAVFHHSSISANFTASFINADATNNKTTSIALVLAQGAVAFMPTAVEINGESQTILWQGGSAPSGTASGTDVVSFTFIRVSYAWTVIGSATSYS